MLTLLIGVAALWISSTSGRRLSKRFLTLDATSLEQFIYGSALGLGIAAMGIYFLGLAGHLSAVPAAAWWGILAIAGLPEYKNQADEFLSWLKSFWNLSLVNESDQKPILAIKLTLLLLLIAASIAIFRPPSAIEWDVISYHLADPKLFILQHKITSLPTDHHSNFPFLTEMLFTSGLLFGGYSAANIFSLITGLLSALSLIAFGRRFTSSLGGHIAALLYISTPLIFWESSVAYIDIASALYSMLAIFAVMICIDDKNETGIWKNSWIIVAGLMMGFCLGTKYLALIPFSLLAVLMAVRRIPFKYIGMYLTTGVLIGSPWYIKNFLLMNNPVYPFYYKLFPHSKYWSLKRGLDYSAEQNRFGYAHSILKSPVVTLRGMLEAPWQLLANAQKYYNSGEYTFSALIGGAYAAFCFPIFLYRRLPRIIQDLSFLVLAQIGLWFLLSQVARYLIQTLPLAAFLAGSSAAWMMKSAFPKHLIRKILIGASTAVIIGQCLYLFISFLLFPTGGLEAMQLIERTGLPPTAISLTEGIQTLITKNGNEKYLTNTLDVFPAEQWINSNTPLKSGVVLYDETRGFYLNRYYLWGNGEHSSYIPYRLYNNGKDLSNWFLNHKIQYAIINLNWSPDNTAHQRIGDEQALTLLSLWFDSRHVHSKWRELVGEAIQSGQWKVEYVRHGCAVLKIERE